MKRENRMVGESQSQKPQGGDHQSLERKKTRLWKRLKAVGMYLEGFHPNTITHSLDVSCRSIFYWAKRFQEGGISLLQERPHPGRPSGLSAKEIDLLSDIIDSRPIAYGFSSGTWT